ncbi:MAG: serine/threonine-protein kinase [Polyangiales bacterium]
MSVQPPTDRHAGWSADVGGETLGPFSLVDEIARGELASVWRVRPIEGESGTAPLVVKRLHRQHARNPEYRSALEREAELAAGFRAQGFVTALRFERTPEPYAVMEYVEGQNLAVLLANARRHDAESARFALPLIVDTLNALEQLHRGQSAHGSLVHQAPVARHILAGVDGSARLIDFTLAMGPAIARAPLCDHRLQPVEMAPEQVLAPTMVDARADIFIVGVTLWEMLTGQRLFDGKNPLESQRRMLSGTIGAPSEASKGVPQAFDRVCRRALARPRGERYPTAQEMAAELRDEAMRVGLWAEPAEVGAWVRTTKELGRTAPRTVPREYARSEAAQTMMGIGGPNPAVLSIADSYRQSQSGSSRGGRRLRSTQSNPPVRRDSSIPIGEEGAESSALVTRGRSQPPLEPEMEPIREPAQDLMAPDLSQLGAGMDFDDGSYAPRRKGGPGFGMIVLAVLGVALAGFGAYMVRARSSSPTKAQTFGAAPVHEAASAEVPPAAWPPPVAPVDTRAASEAIQAPPQVAPRDVAPEAPVKEAAVKEAAAKQAAAKEAAAKEAAAKEAAAKAAAKSAKEAAAKEAASREAAAKEATAKEAPAKETAKAPAEDKPAHGSSEKRRASSKGEQAPRWDVSSTLGGGESKAEWSKPSPGWSNPTPAKPREAGSAAQPDLPINPY